MLLAAVNTYGAFLTGFGRCSPVFTETRGTERFQTPRHRTKKYIFFVNRTAPHRTAPCDSQKFQCGPHRTVGCSK